EAGDGPDRNVYTRAAEYFSAWQRESVLLPDPEPAIYPYSQGFSMPGDPNRTLERRGFIALCQLEDYDRGVVFRHEQTHSAPKTDRLNLLRATRAHFGQIFVLYSDPAGAIDAQLATASAPDVEVADEDGIQHRL